MILSGFGDQASKFVYHHVRLVLGCLCSGIEGRLGIGEKEGEPLTVATTLIERIAEKGP